MGPAPTVRPATTRDATAIAEIYNDAIAERQSTFEWESRTNDDIAAWLGLAVPLLVAERGDRVVGWARISPYSPRPCYSGVGEGSVYVTSSARGQGVGSALAAALRREAEAAGLYKVIGKLFSGNEASRRLVARYGFREVGTHLCHGQLDGEWRDVLLVELLLGPAARAAAGSAAR